MPATQYSAKTPPPAIVTKLLKGSEGKWKKRIAKGMKSGEWARLSKLLHKKGRRAKKKAKKQAKEKEKKAASLALLDQLKKVAAGLQAVTTDLKNTCDKITNKRFDFMVEPARGCLKDSLLLELPVLPSTSANLDQLDENLRLAWRNKHRNLRVSSEEKEEAAKLAH